eukprot:1095468-Rhodomonas_salina.1
MSGTGLAHAAILLRGCAVLTSDMGLSSYGPAMRCAGTDAAQDKPDMDLDEKQAEAELEAGGQGECDAAESNARKHKLSTVCARHAFSCI